ncbi:hypothetical protein HZC21_05890 [Candidatus Peregrinibacteria bacterium]|nr:hypothetical protein [Candidatus Peregrinibacteria bacterium]
MQNSTALEKLSDKELFKKCQMYGAAARLWRQKFIGLLPEVNRRRLYERKGFSSIFEFGAKLCGLSKEQVYLALNLKKRFGDKPVLKRMLENGEVSINKLTRIASIATPENEEELAEKIKILPKNALETWIRDEKQNGSPKPLFGDKDLLEQTLNFEIADDIKEQLNELNSKGIDVNEFLREMLKQRREKIAEEKEKLATESARARQTVSRHIPQKIKKILKEEHGEKCSISTCQKPAEIIHHMQRFSLSQNHDPRFLAPLCKNHHVIAHSVDFKYQKLRFSYLID